ncbi:MAG: dipeptidase PepE [Bacteroidales bacterium]|nr:dipeptidase PepE [Bacteroidales bacterium]
MKKMLLISNSTMAGKPYLEWCREHIKDFYNKHNVSKILFIPYAGVNLSDDGLQASYDAYEKRVAGVFAELGLSLYSIHNEADPVAAVKNAEAIAVGGGNTFHLVYSLHKNKIMDAIKQRVMGGMPYSGWSAGSNIACPSLRTTNDMPIIEPESFNCLNLIPFQINPHYLDANPEGHGGETREQRILEFLTVNQDMYVAGLREGCYFEVEDEKISLHGTRPLRIFRHGKPASEIGPGLSIDFLMKGELL